MKSKLTINQQLCFVVLFFSCIVAAQSCTTQPAGGTTTIVASSCVDSKPDNTPYTKELNAINHFITLDSAKYLADNFTRNKGAILSGKFANDSMILPVSETFNLKAIDSLICQTTTIGFRIYPVLDANNKVRFVLVGVDSTGNDVLQQAAASIRKTGGLLQPVQTIAKAGGSGDNSSSLLLESGQRYP